MRRRVHALEKANRALTAARASDRAELLQTTATASDQDARIRYLTKAAFDQDSRLRALKLANRKLIKSFASDQRPRDAHVVAWRAVRQRALEKEASDQAVLIKTSASAQDARLLALEKKASDQAELIKTSASDRAELRRLRKHCTSPSDELSASVDRKEARLYQDLHKLEARHQHLRDGVFSNLEAVQHAVDEVVRDLRILQRFVDSPHDLVAALSPPLSGRIAAREKLRAQQTKYDTLHFRSPNKAQTELAREVLELRKDLVALS